jgi:eukaryotic-like serine/threonine-protein kinase
VLSEYVDGVLGPEHRRRIQQHLDACATCRGIVSDLARMQVADDDKTDHSPLVTDTKLTTIGPPRDSVGPRHRALRSHIVPGTLIGEYEVTRVLGAGGMGVVFGAIHPRIGKRAAIKILQGDLARDQTAVARFENEARAVNAIGHPNIVDIFAFGELPNGDPYYVMEHVDGKSLQEWIIARGAVSLHQAMPIVRQICDALSAAHERGIIHRDLKPGNVMVAGTDDAPRVTVLDFGLAKMMRDDVHDAFDDSLTSPGVALGTPAFMSPEQCEGSDVDQRTDVYALGVMLYVMLTGRYPFEGGTPTAVRKQHLLHKPRMPSQLVDLPPRVDRIVEKALAKDASARYATVSELRRELEACLSEIPTAQRPVVAVSSEVVATAAVTRAAAPAMQADGARTPVVADVRRGRVPTWVFAAAASAVAASAIAWMVATRARSADSSARVEPVRELPVQIEPPPVQAEPPPPTPAPAPAPPRELVEPSVQKIEPQLKRKPPSRRSKPVKAATKPPPPATGSGASDRMLLEGGQVRAPRK